MKKDDVKRMVEEVLDYVDGSMMLKDSRIGRYSKTGSDAPYYISEKIREVFHKVLHG